MNTGEIVSVAVAGSAVLLSGTAAVGIRSALSRGYSVVLTGPSLRFEPSRPLAHAAADAVAQPLAAGRTMTRRDAAALLGIGEREVRALGKAGVLTEIRQGGRATLVTAESAGRLIAARDATAEKARREIAEVTP